MNRPHQAKTGPALRIVLWVTAAIVCAALAVITIPLFPRNRVSDHVPELAGKCLIFQNETSAQCFDQSGRKLPIVSGLPKMIAIASSPSGLAFTDPQGVWFASNGKIIRLSSDKHVQWITIGNEHSVVAWPTQGVNAEYELLSIWNGKSVAVFREPHSLRTLQYADSDTIVGSDWSGGPVVAKYAPGAKTVTFEVDDSVSSVRVSDRVVSVSAPITCKPVDVHGRGHFGGVRMLPGHLLLVAFSTSMGTEDVHIASSETGSESVLMSNTNSGRLWDMGIISTEVLSLLQAFAKA